MATRSVDYLNAGGASRHYIEALRWAVSYGKLIVTGSQRSGTTICAQMLASDLGWRFVDETAVDVGSIDKAESLMRGDEPVVLQMPNLLTRTGEMADFIGLGGLGVVVMRRRFWEVERSRLRIGLKPRLGRMVCRQMYIRVRFAFRTHFRVLDFADLVGHPLHVAAQHRRNFTRKQTRFTD